MANPRDTHGRGHPARPHPGQRPAQDRGAGAEPAGLSQSLTRPSPGAQGKDEHRHRLQLTGLRAPERPRTHLRHGSAARLGMCRCEVSETPPIRRPPRALRSPEERARGSSLPALPGAGASTGATSAEGLTGTRLSPQRGDGAGGPGRRGGPLLGKHHSDPRQVVGRLRQQAPTGIWR